MALSTHHLEESSMTDKNKKPMLTGRIGTFKGKKYDEKPTDAYITKEDFKKAKEKVKKRKGSGASGAIVRLKDITGRPDPTKKNFMAGGMVNPSYGTEFDDR